MYAEQRSMGLDPHSAGDTEPCQGLSQPGLDFAL
jgi:hypothetical protein